MVALFIYSEIRPCRFFFLGQVIEYFFVYMIAQSRTIAVFYCTICLPKPAQFSFFFSAPCQKARFTKCSPDLIFFFRKKSKLIKKIAKNSSYFLYLSYVKARSFFSRKSACVQTVISTCMSSVCRAAADLFSCEQFPRWSGGSKRCCLFFNSTAEKSRK